MGDIAAPSQRSLWDLNSLGQGFHRRTQGATKPRLDRTLANIEHCRNVFGASPIKIVEHQSELRLLRKFCQGNLKLTVITRLRPSWVSLPSGQARLTPTFSYKVNAQIPCDSADPRPKLLVVAQAVYACKTFQQRLLGDILSVMPVAERSQADCKNAGRTGPYQVRVCRFVSCPASCRQIFFRIALQLELQFGFP